MKILFSQLKELIPGLDATPQEVGEALTMIGFMTDGLSEVRWRGKKDFLLSFEIRQNRADCLSVLGLAKETAAYFGLRTKESEVETWTEGKIELNPKIDAKEVKRVLAIKLDGAVNKPSPDWLKEYLSFYDINSVNLLVDLSNYVMLYTGYTSHLIDADKLQGGLVWKVNKIKRQITTLDDSVLDLIGGELTIEDDKQVIALAGIVGAKTAAISLSSTGVIIEMAVYDRFVIKQNSRQLAVVTEASNRLSKEMSRESAAEAFNLLVSLCVKETGGRPASKLFDYYPEADSQTAIEFNPSLVSRLGGITVTAERSREILENLRFKTQINDADSWLVTPPADRLDVSVPEDLVEEVLRLNLFTNIPANETPGLSPVNDITPPLWHLKENLRDIMTTMGYDEILSQPLTAVLDNQEFNRLDWKLITTLNSVNEEYPALRQSMAIGLVNQLKAYGRRNVNPIKIFEIGKVFGRQGKKYSEAEWLGAVSRLSGNGLAEVKRELEVCLGQIGLKNLVFKPAKGFPAANPFNSWEVLVDNQPVAYLTKLKASNGDGLDYYWEFDLAAAYKLLDNGLDTAELTGRLVSLDANLNLNDATELLKKLSDTSKKAKDKLWSLEVIDEYRLKDMTRYTVRAVYRGLSDTEAKDAHIKLFGLK